MLLCCENYLLSGYHVALELLMAFVPSVLAFACSFTTGSEGQRHFISQWSQVWNRYRRLKEPTPFWIKNSFGCYDLTCNIRLLFFSVHTRDVSQECRCTNRSMGAAWPQLPSASAGGRSAAACPAGPEPPDSPGADSPTGWTAPSASVFAWKQTTGILIRLDTDRRIFPRQPLE